MTITAAHAINAIIPATREPGKKIAATHATKNEAQPAALMVSFRILHSVSANRAASVSVMAIFHQLTRVLLKPRLR
jgi:hypothetical protein